MAENDANPACSFCARGPDIIRIQLFQKWGSQHPGKYCRQRASQRQRGQNQVRPLSSSWNRQPAKADWKKQNEERSQPEMRDRNASDGKQAGETIDRFVRV